MLISCTKIRIISIDFDDVGHRMKTSQFDFTIVAYSGLLDTLADYRFHPFNCYPGNSSSKWVILRHDVDLLPTNSLLFAYIQQQAGIQGTYYFRIVPNSFNPRIIEQIARLGHEIGYHYEDVSFVARQIRAEIPGWREKKLDANLVIERAIESFSTNLATLRKYADIKTICMHGSPFSSWDSRLLWSKYDYHDFGLIGEPYFDIDFHEVAYYTDTGRRWDGEEVNLRDKPLEEARGQKSEDKEQIKESRGHKFPGFHSTFDIIGAAKKCELPQKIMFTFHPQRWTNNAILWLKELALQNAKNVVKRYWLVPRNEKRRLT